jgi:hypothetical protein
VDPELLTKAADVSHARDEFNAAQYLGYGTSNVAYVTALRALEAATNAYEAKIAGIMKGLETLVVHDRRLLNLISNEEYTTRNNANLEAATNRAYFSLKRDVENTQRVVDDLGRRVIEEEVEVKQPIERAVIVHDPARPNKRARQPQTACHHSRRRHPGADRRRGHGLLRRIPGYQCQDH